jgi:outer membrane murein-binding lipoprotein Lpp
MWSGIVHCSVIFFFVLCIMLLKRGLENSCCPHSLQMRLIAALIIATALTAGLVSVMSDITRGFDLGSDGSRAIFSFRDSNWDAVFGTISLRDMNGKVDTLEQDLNAAHAELNATRAELSGAIMKLDALTAV